MLSVIVTIDYQGSCAQQITSIPTVPSAHPHPGLRNTLPYRHWLVCHDIQGLIMTAQFLRDEAARFRGMAGDTDRPATRERLLAMAADYETRAGVANELTDPDPGNANSEPVPPTRNEAPKTKLGRKAAAGLKETVLVQRRPVGRSTRE